MIESLGHTVGLWTMEMACRSRALLRFGGIGDHACALSGLLEVTDSLFLGWQGCLKCANWADTNCSPANCWFWNSYTKYHMWYVCGKHRNPFQSWLWPNSHRKSDSVFSTPEYESQSVCHIEYLPHVEAGKECPCRYVRVLCGEFPNHTMEPDQTFSGHSEKNRPQIWELTRTASHRVVQS